MQFQKSRKAFFFTGAVAILLVLLIASTMTWVAVSNARSERAPLITQGQQVQNIVQSIMGYQRALQVASEMAFYLTNLHMREDIPGSPLIPAKNERYECIYPDISAHQSPPGIPDPLCDIDNSNDPIVRDSVIKYFFCDTLSTYAQVWIAKIRQLGNEMGLDVVITEDADAEERCKISMDDYRTVKVEYKGTYEIKDKATGQLLASGKLPGEAYVDINGYEDPAIWDWARQAPGLFTVGPIKNIYFSDSVGTSPAGLVPDQKATGMRGKGWFYGKAISDMDTSIDRPECVDASDPDLTNLKKCMGVIFAVTWIGDGLDPPPGLDKYGAVILILSAGKTPTPDPPALIDCDNDPITPPDYALYTETAYCLDCLRYLKNIASGEITTDPSVCPSPPTPLPPLGPYGKNPISAPFITVDGPTNPYATNLQNLGKYHLIGSSSVQWINTIGPSAVHNIWYIENLRATAVCGFYMQNDDGPRFLLRMIKDGEKYVGPEDVGTGIESLLVGIGVNAVWNGNSPILDRTGIYSNVDHVYLDQLGPPKDSSNTFRMKGMPGCRELEQCSYLTPAGQNSPIGHFAIDYTGHSIYDPVGILQCPEGTPSDYYASCDSSAPPAVPLPG